MSVNVGTAYLEIVPSAKGFAGKLQGEVSGQMARAGQDAGRRYSRGLSSSALPGFKRVASAATGLFAVLGAGKIAKFGLDIASQNEQAQISFSTMLGSATKARNFIKKLQVFAAKTPFDFPGLQKSASSLISIGVNANDVIPIMTTLGNVTSGMGTGAEGVQRATVALQQMIASQRITGEDLNQLRDAGIPVYSLLAKATGKSQAEVVKLAQAGKLGKKELTQMLAALKSGKGLERFGGLMDKQSQSLAGLASTFKDTFGQNLAAAIQPLIPLLKDGMGKASAFLAEQMPKVSKALAEFIAQMKSGEGTGGKVVAILKVVGKVLGTVFGFLAKHKETVVTFVAVLGALTIAFAAVNAVMAINPISLVVIAIAALVTGLILAYKHSETFRKIVDAAFRAIAVAIDFAKNHWKLLLALILGPFGVAIVGVVTHFKTVERVVRTVLKGIVDLWFTVVGALVHGAAKAFGWVPGIGGKLKSAAKHFDEFRDNVNASLSGIKDKTITVNIAPKSIRAPRPKIFDELGIPQGATGAIVRRPTLALIGEAGPEAVVPLNRTPGNTPLPAPAASSSDSSARQRLYLVLDDGTQLSGYVDTRIGAQRGLDGMQVRAFG